MRGFGSKICSLHHSQLHLSNKKALYNGYRNPHYKTKTVCWPSQVYDGNPYSNKTVSPEWIWSQIVIMGYSGWHGDRKHLSSTTMGAVKDYEVPLNDRLYIWVEITFGYYVFVGYFSLIHIPNWQTWPCHVIHIAPNVRVFQFSPSWLQMAFSTCRLIVKL